MVVNQQKRKRKKMKTLHVAFQNIRLHFVAHASSPLAHDDPSHELAEKDLTFDDIRPVKSGDVGGDGDGGARVPPSRFVFTATPRQQQQRQEHDRGWAPL